MVKVFIQGMRRSGTTIVFDILSQDRRLDAWYEPFSITRAARQGGGSGEQAIDFAARIRAAREAQCARGVVTDPDFFNWGAPRDPALELDGELPAACRDYLRAMLDAHEHTLIKFVRMFHKVARLRELAPDSRLIHVVRDPRAVVTSQLLGPDRAKAERFRAEKKFFHHRGSGVLWASRALGNLLTARPEYAHLAGTCDVRLILLLWRHTFRHTCDDGRAAFRDHYLLLRHEDLATDPRAGVERVYRFLDLPPDPAALAFATSRLRPPAAPMHAGSERWIKAIDEVGMQAELAAAGYRADGSPSPHHP